MFFFFVCLFVLFVLTFYLFSFLFFFLFLRGGGGGGVGVRFPIKVKTHDQFFKRSEKKYVQELKDFKEMSFTSSRACDKCFIRQLISFSLSLSSLTSSSFILIPTNPLWLKLIQFYC